MTILQPLDFSPTYQAWQAKGLKIGEHPPWSTQIECAQELLTNAVGVNPPLLQWVEKVIQNKYSPKDILAPTMIKLSLSSCLMDNVAAKDFYAKVSLLLARHIFNIPYIIELPSELIMTICSLLPLKDRYNLAQSCRSLKIISHDSQFFPSSLMRQLYAARLPNLNPVRIKLSLMAQAIYKLNLSEPQQYFALKSQEQFIDDEIRRREAIKSTKYAADDFFNFDKPSIVLLNNHLIIERTFLSWQKITYENISPTVGKLEIVCCGPKCLMQRILDYFMIENYVDKEKRKGFRTQLEENGFTVTPGTCKNYPPMSGDDCKGVILDLTIGQTHNLGYIFYLLHQRKKFTYEQIKAIETKYTCDVQTYIGRDDSLIDR